MKSARTVANKTALRIPALRANGGAFWQARCLSASVKQGLQWVRPNRKSRGVGRLD